MEDQTRHTHRGSGCEQRISKKRSVTVGCRNGQGQQQRPGKNNQHKPENNNPKGRKMFFLKQKCHSTPLKSFIYFFIVS